VLVVAYFPTTWWILDGRYATSLAIPFALLATLLVQRLTIPGRWAAVVPIVALAVVLAVSIRGLQIQDLLRRDVHQNDTAAIARVLEANGLRCVVGNYWAVEPFSYLGGDRVLAEADSPVRFPETRARITASPGRYAILQRADMPPDPLPAGFAPTPVRAGDTFVFLPAPRAAAVPGAPC
jgi:hypothetical protein